jgi:methionyl-tRNA formyltransferase
MRLLFIGSGEIGLPTLRYLLDSHEHELVGVVTQPDKPAGRSQAITAPPVKTAAAQRGIVVLQPRRIKDPAALEEIRALKPEAIIVMAYGQILPRTLLELPKIACLNLHASLLPRWRGAAPIQAAIAAGDEVTGITVMYMNEGLDTGDVLLTREVAVSGQETGGSLHDKLAAVAPAALADALHRLASGTAPRIPQDESRATYAPKLEREQGRIDWREPADVIERKIRAFDPWPGAFTAVNDPAGGERKLKIFKACLGDGPLSFATGDGLLTILEAQLEGARRMPAEELLRGHAWLRRNR